MYVLKRGKMKLKIKFIKWNAGIPSAMLDKNTADKMGIHTGDRISIKTLSKYPQEIAVMVDLVDKIVGKNQVAVSSEISDKINLKKSQVVDVNLASTSKSVLHIKKKLDGKKLSQKEINEIVRDVVNNSLSQAEVALFISSMYVRGMDFKETIYLIKAILKTGNMLSLKSKFVVDKHSIGGIPGNRVTPIVVSICAAAGLVFPKTSSRAITSAAGTADVMEAIAKVEFSIKETREIIKKVGACIVWGGSIGMVPADSKIISTEKILKIDPQAQLLASIMSKKLAVGSRYILIDIPYGKHAKLSKLKSLRLKRKFERLGRYFHKKLKVVLTKGDQPIGNGVGPSLELMDIVKILDPSQNGPEDLQKKSVFMAGQLLEMTGKAKSGKGENLAMEILSSGKAFEKFKEIVKAQQGSLKKIKYAKLKHDLHAKSSGRVREIHNKKINELARLAGCPVDKSAGIYIDVHLGNRVKKGSKIATIYSETKARLTTAIDFFNSKKPIKIR